MVYEGPAILALSYCLQNREPSWNRTLGACARFWLVPDVNVVGVELSSGLGEGPAGRGTGRSSLLRAADPPGLAQAPLALSQLVMCGRVVD